MSSNHISLSEGNPMGNHSFISASSSTGQALPASLESPYIPPTPSPSPSVPSVSAGSEGPQSASRSLEIAELALGIATEDGDVPNNDKTDVDMDGDKNNSIPRGNLEMEDGQHAKKKCPSCDNVAMVICSMFALSVVVASIALVTWLFLNGLSRLE